ncbi:MAG TPA: transglutaminase-like domain-containing protein [Thermoleophilaceae bacterium]|nr:transglutaminase-like domain-containing protein [Thermoleophilaceae bacterium]
MRLIVFGAFAAYGASHWAMLVAGPSPTTIAATVGAATAGAAALVLLDRSRLPRRAVQALAALVVLIALCAGLVVTGIAPRLLLPTGWGELADQLDHALLGIQGVDWPYDGPDEWIRLTILLGAPLLLTTAAALAFWPASPEARTPLRGAALVLLIAVYALAVTTNSPGSPLLFGALLLSLIAAWLWLPRRGVREWAAGGLVVAATALLALPAAAALDGDGPWLDYRSWSPFGDDAGIAFSWDHGYGPLDWPRQGTTLLNVRSDRPHYWKAETLNSFDGVHWYRATGDEQSDLSAELPFDPDQGGFGSEAWGYGRLNPDWNDEIQFTVRSLSTELLVGAGLTYDVSGAAAVPSADGTTQLLDRLERGDSYTIRSYQPNPNALVMAGVPKGYPSWVKRYTELSLPAAGAEVRTVVVPPRGNRSSAADRADAETALTDSVYSRVYELAVALTADSASTYDAVAAIETHLRDGYRYSEDVPQHAYPLESFLFQDRQGYCQQFSGAMALMLRMVGIPARVAAGFSPGTLNRQTGEYRVRDLDAHSWVEVYFSGIGWVTFDPTPRATDASSAGAPAAPGANAAAGDVQQSSIAPEPVPDANAAGDGSGDDDGATGTPSARSSAGDGLPTAALVLVAGLAALALVSTLVFAVRVRRRNALDREQLAAAEIGELRSALDQLGWDVSPATTLLVLERQLEATAGPRAAAYARALRDCRFDPQRSEPPGPADRRALRRALGATAGPLGPLRALIALPPG